jgi:hypothetical protein
MKLLTKYYKTKNYPIKYDGDLAMKKSYKNENKNNSHALTFNHSFGIKIRAKIAADRVTKRPYCAKDVENCLGKDENDFYRKEGSNKPSQIFISNRTLRTSVYNEYQEYQIHTNDANY